MIRKLPFQACKDSTVIYIFNLHTEEKILIWKHLLMSVVWVNLQKNEIVFMANNTHEDEPGSKYNQLAIIMKTRK